MNRIKSVLLLSGIAVLAFFLFSCLGEPPKPVGYRIPAVLKDYFVFGNGSWWEYQADSATTERVDIEIVNKEIDHFDREVLQYKLKTKKTEWVETYIGGEARSVIMGEKTGSYNFETNKKQDSVTGRFWKTTDTLFYMDSSIVSGKTFRSVVVAKIPQNSLCEIWLAPKVGIIKKVYKSGVQYVLKDYEIK